MATETADSHSKHSDEPRKARVAILTAARRVQSREGAAAMTIAAVAKEASVTPEAVCGHFQTAQEILVALAADDLASLARAQSGEGKEKDKPSKNEAQGQPRENMRKKAVLSAPLEQVMKEVAPEPDKDGVVTGALARLERRVQVMEKAFADVVERHERSLRERSGSLASIEESIGAVLSRMDASDKQHSQTMSEFRQQVADACLRLNTLEEVKSQSSVSGSPMLSELPPVPDMPPIQAIQKPAEAAGAQRIEDPPKADAKGGEPAKPPMSETYLSAARRAANAAVASTTADERMAAKRDMMGSRKSSRAKFLFFACLAPVAILGAAFMVLNRNPVTAEPVELSQSASISPPSLLERAGLPAPSSEGVPQAGTAGASATVTQKGSSASLERLAEQARAGDMKAERDVGLRYLAGEGTGVDESEAARWLMRAAYKGEPTAEYWLATLYARGHGVPADAFQANHWYEAAAKKGNRRAMHSLAVANFQGSGVEKNFVEAARWFQRAAELGLVDSQFNLAVLFERGSGVPQSLTDAYKWYAIAAANGDKEADARVAVLAKELRPADLALAQSAVASFKPMAMDEAANLTNGPVQLPGD
jgi:localization factor PodJL